MRRVSTTSPKQRTGLGQIGMDLGRAKRPSAVRYPFAPFEVDWVEFRHPSAPDGGGAAEEAGAGYARAGDIPDPNSPRLKSAVASS